MFPSKNAIIHEMRVTNADYTKSDTYSLYMVQKISQR